ncbi:MAG: methyltransferase [Croceitalea sp.]|nr:methyltransferase [Croceitalea sp.]NNC33479.1 methyltransferase [Croceitalea sp.]
MSKTFQFKQFSINQDRTAMKVGTDGVLLGAWTKVEQNPNTILDIGTGTGLIALQMAQRSFAETIDALEIEAVAFEQAVANFEASPWADRLFCYHASLQEFVNEMDDRYDLIVSNPPFYAETMGSGSDARDTARQELSLPFDTLLAGVAKLLTPKGEFTTVIPYKEESEFLKKANLLGLHVYRITHVKGTPSAQIKRSLLQFSFESQEMTNNMLIIETDRHNYTKDYIALTKDFYLKM